MGEGDGDVLMHAGGHAVSALHALSMGEHSNTPENRPPAGWLVPENRGVLQVTTSSRWQRGGPMGHGDKDRRRREVGELRRSQLGQKKFGPWRNLLFLLNHQGSNFLYFQLKKESIFP